MPNATIGITTHFDAAHKLELYKGKCNNLHGHTWYIEVKVTGAVNQQTGMVMDLVELKGLVADWVERHDHRYLNDLVVGEPTCENLSLALAAYLKRSIAASIYLGKIHYVEVKIQEGSGGFAISLLMVI